MLAHVKSLIAITALVASLPLLADETITPLTAKCLVEAADAQAIHPDVLLAILMVEGGTVGQNSRPNGNGSYDIGLFQINSIHRQAVAELGVTESMLRNNGCVNAQVAAWHLRRVLPPEKEAAIESEREYLRAIATYHSATPQYNEIYADKLRRAFTQIYRAN